MLPDNAILKVVIVDDEKEACLNLESIFKDYFYNRLNVAGMAQNTKEADLLIRKSAPDAVFLDIEMPNENAFNYLARIAPFNFEVVFVTAYDEYAVKAFKLNAVDYLLKPLSINEVGLAIQKLYDKINLKFLLSENSNALTELSQQVLNKAKAHKITLRDNNIIEVVDFKDIYFVEAQGSYIRVVFLKESGVKEIIMSGSLTDYEELLPVDFFFRIHKSYLINCMHVKKIIKDEYNQVVIHENFLLPVSRRRYTPLLDFLKRNDFYNE